ncbi:MAG: ornithine cyclodeaminase [Paraglaciecola sp.]|jgi:ornithine cyclodeaminase
MSVYVGTYQGHRNMKKNLALKNQNVPFMSVENLLKLVSKIGIENFLSGLAESIKQDFGRWHEFEKSPRFASHSPEGVIELMPISDGNHFSFKYVNGPNNTKRGLQTVTAFGVLADVDSGYPILLTEMTVLTALRTAANSALVAKYLAPSIATTLALIGNGAQSEFQALAFKAIVGITKVKLFDTHPGASEKCYQNLQNSDLIVEICPTAEAAIEGAHIITTYTADKCNATILTDEMIGNGVHINAIGGDCPGKTELDKNLLLRGDVFIEFEPQTRIEGDIQQLDVNSPVTEFHSVITDHKNGRVSADQLTIFDGVGFALEDFSALRYLHKMMQQDSDHQMLDLLAKHADPRNLFGLFCGGNANVLSEAS